MQKIGFLDIRRGEELPFGMDEVAQYPMFTPELLTVMRRLIPAERQGHVARSVVFTARK